MKTTMIRLTCLLAVVGVLAVPSFAQVPHLYLAGFLQTYHPTGDFGKETIHLDGGNAELGNGTELNVGLMSDFGSTYIGYRWAKFGTQGKAALDWQDVDRWVAGIRWHMLGTLRSPVVPVLGVGITVGKSKLGVNSELEENIQKVSKQIESDNSVGWFLEAGVRLRAVGPISALGSIQYHRFDTTFEDAILTKPTDFTVTFFTTQLGLQYTF